MIVFVGINHTGHEHLYCVHRFDRLIHCLTRDYQFSHYQEVLVSPNRRFVLFTALDDEHNKLLHYAFDVVQGSIRILDFTFDEYRLVKWLNNTKILVASEDGYAIVDKDTANIQHIDTFQKAITFDITSDERYVAMTTDQAGFTVNLWDRKLDTIKNVDLREDKDSCWIEAVAGWTSDERFFAVVANYSELWLIAQDGQYWYKLANLEYFHLTYRWSPDSQWLSYFRALDHGGPGTTFGIICLVNKETLVHRDLVTINNGEWGWLSDTEIVCISRDNHDIVVDVIDVPTGRQTRLLLEDEPMTNFYFR